MPINNSMEYFDLVDKNGQSINKTKLRAEVHRDGDWHRAVDIWVLNSSRELLIQRRSLNKESYPGLWEISCSGHISAGEESLSSAVRELEEELGIKVEAKDLNYIFETKEEQTTNNGSFVNNEYKDVYLLEIDIDETQLSLQEEEVMDAKFIEFHDLQNQIKTNPENFVPHTNGYSKIFQYLFEKFDKNSSQD